MLSSHKSQSEETTLKPELVSGRRIKSELNGNNVLFSNRLSWQFQQSRPHLALGGLCLLETLWCLTLFLPGLSGVESMEYMFVFANVHSDQEGKYTSSHLMSEAIYPSLPRSYSLMSCYSLNESLRRSTDPCSLP